MTVPVDSDTLIEVTRGVDKSVISIWSELSGSDSAEVGRHAGDYMRRYRKSHGLELGDAIIGASAVISKASLWTRSRKHYPMRKVTFFGLAPN